MPETQLTTSSAKIDPEYNAETGKYEEPWPYEPWKKPRKLELYCGCCNTDKVFETRQKWEAHKKGVFHQAQFERWKSDEKEKQDLRDRILQLEKKEKRHNRKEKKLLSKSLTLERKLAEVNERYAQLELKLDDTRSDSEDDFEDAESD